MKSRAYSGTSTSSQSQILITLWGKGTSVTFDIINETAEQGVTPNWTVLLWSSSCPSLLSVLLSLTSLCPPSAPQFSLSSSCPSLLPTSSSVLLLLTLYTPSSVLLLLTSICPPPAPHFYHITFYQLWLHTDTVDCSHQVVSLQNKQWIRLECGGQGRC